VVLYCGDVLRFVGAESALLRCGQRMPRLPLADPCPCMAPCAPRCCPTAAVREAYLAQAEQTVKAVLRLGFTIRYVAGAKGVVESGVDDPSLASAVSGG
jgi:hypothetical protein